jgi:hypothetical protein
VPRSWSSVETQQLAEIVTEVIEARGGAAAQPVGPAGSMRESAKATIDNINWDWVAEQMQTRNASSCMKKWCGARAALMGLLRLPGARAGAAAAAPPHPPAAPACLRRLLGAAVLAPPVDGRQAWGAGRWARCVGWAARPAQPRRGNRAALS